MAATNFAELVNVRNLNATACLRNHPYAVINKSTKDQVRIGITPGYHVLIAGTSGTIQPEIGGQDLQEGYLAVPGSGVFSVVFKICFTPPGLESDGSIESIEAQIYPSTQVPANTDGVFYQLVDWVVVDESSVNIQGGGLSGSQECWFCGDNLFTWLI